MKRIVIFCLLVMLAMSMALPAYAANGQVSYLSDAEKFFFEPGTNYSPTDLFPDFKDVMPGDSIQQRILVKNDRPGAR